MKESLYITDPQGEQPNGCRDIFIGYAIGIAIAFLCCVFFCGCKTQTVVTVPEIHKEYVHDTLTKVDSVYQYHYIKEKGDTVWRIDSVFAYRVIYKSVVENHVDSVPYPVEVQVPVRYRNGYDKFTSWFFWIVVIVFGLWAAWKICDKIPACKPYTAIIRGILKIGKFF